MKTKLIRRLPVALIFGVLVTFLFSVNVLAETKYVKKSMTLDETVAVKSLVIDQGNYTFTMYKFTVPSGKFIKLTCIPSAENHSYAYFYTKPDVSNMYRVSLLSDNQTRKTWTDRLAVAPGTYYVSFENVKKAKLVLMDSPNKTNYCRARAISLTADKKVTVIQTPDIDYNRWYKITLTKAKKLKITSNHMPRITVSNKNGSVISFGSYNSTTKSVTSTNKLPKGTYYICVNAFNYIAAEGNAGDKKGDYFVFKWN